MTAPERTPRDALAEGLVDAAGFVGGAQAVFMGERQRHQLDAARFQIDGFYKGHSFIPFQR